MKYVKHLKSGMFPGYDGPIGQRTCFLGASGDGKTNVARGVMWGLSGTVHDYQGKPVESTKKNIAGLFINPKHGGVTLTLSDDSVHKWSTKSTGKPQFPPDVPQPIMAKMTAALSANGNVAREFLAPYLDSFCDWSAVDAYIGKHRNVEDIAWWGMVYTEQTLARLDYIATKAAEEQRSTERELGRDRKRLESLPVPEKLVTKEQVDAAKREHAEQQERLWRLNQQRKTWDQWAANCRELERLEAKCTGQPMTAERRKLLESQIPALGLATEPTQDKCPTCTRPMDPALKKRISGILGTIMQRLAGGLDMDDWSRLDELRALTKTEPPKGIGPDQRHVNRLARDMLELENRYNGQKQRAEIEQRIEQADNAMLEYSRRTGFSRNVAVFAFRSAVERFTSAVSRYLPGDDSYWAEVPDGKNSKFRHGIQRNGKRIDWLCGTEIATMQAAIASALAEQGRASLIIVPDRDIDIDARRELMRSLANCPAQVLMTCTVRESIADRVAEYLAVDGWTIVRV